jgi:hypothetical protein
MVLCTKPSDNADSTSGLKWNFRKATDPLLRLHSLSVEWRGGSRSFFFLRPLAYTFDGQQESAHMADSSQIRLSILLEVRTYRKKNFLSGQERLWVSVGMWICLCEGRWQTETQIKKERYQEKQKVVSRGGSLGKLIVNVKAPVPRRIPG